MQNQRSYFGRQPARVVLVDCTPPFTIDACCNVQEALKDIFTLVCSLSGPSRTPFFGLVALGNYPEVLFPLQHTKSNYPRMQASISELGKFHQECAGGGGGGGTSARTRLAQCVQQGLSEAVSMFKRQAQSLLQTAGYWAQLEVTIITCHSAIPFSRHVMKAVKDLDVDSLKKVQVVSLSQPEQMDLAGGGGGDLLEAGSQASDASTDDTDDTASVVDILTIDRDVLSLQSFLKGWLQDNGTDKEHLHLTIGHLRGEVTTLKCDLLERVINPTLLPFANNFTVQPDAVQGKAPNASAAKGSGFSTPVFRLKVVAKIPGEAVCESVLFGLPSIVKATSCWKIDWDELETNQQNFHALCHSLQAKDLVLLAAIEDEKASKTSAFQYELPQSKPNGHFLLLPSQSSTLLIKPVAVSELLLPCEAQFQDKPNHEALSTINHCLEQVETRSSYNPLLVYSGLYSCLNGMLCKNMPSVSYMGGRRPGLSKNQGTVLSAGRGKPKRATRSITWEEDDSQEIPNQKQPRFSSGRDFYSHATSSSFPTEL